MELGLSRKRYPPALLLPIILAGFILAPRAGAHSDPFPIYPCIQPNVSFWTKIYTDYSSNQGVLHDKNNLSIIYGAIELADPDKQGADRARQK
jgi:membrane-bound lytic murein transglycosylase D